MKKWILTVDLCKCVFCGFSRWGVRSRSAQSAWIISNRNSTKWSLPSRWKILTYYQPREREYEALVILFAVCRSLITRPIAANYVLWYTQLCAPVISGVLHFGIRISAVGSRNEIQCFCLYITVNVFPRPLIPVLFLGGLITALRQSTSGSIGVGESASHLWVVYIIDRFEVGLRFRVIAGASNWP